jgi:hypothetical protein
MKRARDALARELPTATQRVGAFTGLPALFEQLGADRWPFSPMPVSRPTRSTPRTVACVCRDG